MRRNLIGGLWAVNLGLTALLFHSLRTPVTLTGPANQPGQASNTESRSISETNPSPGIRSTKRRAGKPAPEPTTPFAAVYSTDFKQFASNLRTIGCPEQTVKDILEAAAHERYRGEEEALRSTPADHVPLGWSPNTCERRLVVRRLQAAAVAREQSALLTGALGYEVSIPPPVYALRSSDQKFETAIAELAPGQQSAARRIQEDYWTKVLSLEDKTKGFWQPQDLVELDLLKEQRSATLSNVLGRR